MTGLPAQQGQSRHCI